MKSDIPEKRLEDFNDVFADIHNALVFGGKEILKEERLTALPTEAFTKKRDDTSRQGNRDIRKADGEHGQYRLICGLENPGSSCIKLIMSEKDKRFWAACGEQAALSV